MQYHDVNLPGGALAEAIEGIKAGDYSCALVREDRILHTGTGRGVAPLMQLHRGDITLMQGSAVADKIIGKAAAMLVKLGGGAYVYGETMSQAAVDWLEKNRLPYSYGRLVRRIKNREGDGLCPIEESVLHIENPAEALPAIAATIDRLMAAK